MLWGAIMVSYVRLKRLNNASHNRQVTKNPTQIQCKLKYSVFSNDYDKVGLKKIVSSHICNTYDRLLFKINIMQN